MVDAETRSTSMYAVRELLQYVTSSGRLPFLLFNLISGIICVL